MSKGNFSPLKLGYLASELPVLWGKTHSQVLNYILNTVKSPYIQPLQLWTFRDANLCLHVRSHKLVHMSGISWVRASSKSDCIFVYFIV